MKRLKRQSPDHNEPGSPKNVKSRKSAPSLWLECGTCGKERRVDPKTDERKLKKGFHCRLNYDFDPNHASCRDPEEIKESEHRNDNIQDSGFSSDVSPFSAPRSPQPRQSTENLLLTPVRKRPPRESKGAESFASRANLFGEDSGIKPRGPCRRCGRPLQPIGSARANGKAHDEWPTRQLHKQCWLEEKKEEEEEEEEGLDLWSTAFAPPCRKCDLRCEEKTSHSDANYGRQYWYCSTHVFSHWVHPDPEGPGCNKCGDPCVKRKSRSKRNFGREYWCCPTHTFSRWVD